jgi:hypothetical protein
MHLRRHPYSARSLISYNTDRATYHVSGVLEKIPIADVLKDEVLIDLFSQFDARQVMHVTFDSVLDIYGSQLKDILKANSDLYQVYLKVHFDHHLKPFVSNKE